MKMQVSVSRAMAVGLLGLALTAGSVLNAAPRERVMNGDFAVLTNGVPAGWEAPSGYPGKVSLLAGGGIRFEVADGGLADDDFKNAGILAGTAFTVTPGARHVVSVEARGSGRLAPSLMELGKGGGFQGTKRVGEEKLDDTWKTLTYDYVPDPTVGRASPALALYGPKVAAEIRRMSVVADTARELLDNTDFKAMKDGLPVGWGANNKSATIEKTTDPQEGEVLRLAGPGAGLQDIFCGKRVVVKAGATYRIRLRARNLEGKTGLIAIQHGIGGGNIGSQGVGMAPPEWETKEFVYRPTLAEIGAVTLAFNLTEGVALVKSLSMTFDPADNPGFTEDGQPALKRTLRVHVQTRDATARVLANGNEQPVQSEWASVEIDEGVLCLAVEARGTGPHPGLKLSIDGHPETDGRWSCATQSGEGWAQAAFDDAAWATPADHDGWFWPQEGGEQAFFRQGILWNEAFNGPDLCLFPRVKEQWAFPRDGMEILIFKLGFPSSNGLSSYTLRLDLPAPFGIHDPIVRTAPNRLGHTQPTSVSQETVMRNGKPYRRYVLSYPPAAVNPAKPNFTLIGLKQEWKLDDPVYDLYYSRLANRNMTELEQRIPMAILPPIRGVMPKKLLIQRYLSIYPYMATMNRSMLADHTKAVLAMGQNFFSVSFLSEHEHAFYKGGVEQAYDMLAGTPARCFMSLGCWPLNGGYVPRKDPSGALAANEMYPIYARWVTGTPEALGRYFKKAPGEGNRYYFCNQYVIDHPESYQAAVSAQMKSNLERFPKVENLFLDWEPGPEAFKMCFCDRCKEAFRQRAGLAAEVDLSDDAVILEQYRKPWQEFREWQDGQFFGRFREMANRLGLTLMMYTGEGGVIRESADKIDIFFDPGLNDPIGDHNFERKFAWTEGTRQRFRERNIPVIGQFIWTWYFGRTVYGTLDGYYHPQKWKNSIIRAILIHNGGIDVDDPLSMGAGSLYYQGEATRLLAAFEDFFTDGERADDLVESADLKPLNRIVLRKGDERLVLLFNDSDQPVEATIENKGLKPGQTARLYEGDSMAAARMNVTIAPDDVVAVHIQ